jgi:hypothetical protein
MTTVIVDTDRMALAADSRCTGHTIFETRKIFTLADGTLVGICGVVNDALKFVDWVSRGYDREKLPTFSEDGFEAITVGPQGVHVWDMACMCIEVSSRYYAMGTGARYALGALHCGRTIEEAVAVSCALDPGSGGKIVSEAYIAPTPRAVPRRKPATKPAVKASPKAKPAARKAQASRK